MWGVVMKRRGDLFCPLHFPPETSCPIGSLASLITPVLICNTFPDIALGDSNESPLPFALDWPKIPNTSMSTLVPVNGPQKIFAPCLTFFKYITPFLIAAAPLSADCNVSGGKYNPFLNDPVSHP